MLHGLNQQVEASNSNSVPSKQGRYPEAITAKTTPVERNYCRLQRIFSEPQQLRHLNSWKTWNFQVIESSRFAEASRRVVNAGLQPIKYREFLRGDMRGHLNQTMYWRGCTEYSVLDRYMLE